MNPYYPIIKAFLNHETYSQYSKAVDFNNLKEEQPEIYRLGQLLHRLHEGSIPQVYTLADLRLAYAAHFPGTSETVLKPIFEVLQSTDVKPEVLTTYLKAAKARTKALETAKVALAVAEGRAEANALQGLLTQFEEDVSTTQKSDFINDDIDELYDKYFAAPGLQWRLPSLNRNLGSLRQGNFGFIFARPETGKTTFLASEITFMAGQTQGKGPILWFNNEGVTQIVLARCIQAACGVDSNDLFRNRHTLKQQYSQSVHNNIRFAEPECCNKSDIERLARIWKPSLIVIDQIDKVRGFHGDRNDLELGAIYQWARDLAIRYCPVIGICQAGQSAEGKKWITMNDVDNSKTSKQAEADWILGIGKSMDEALAYERFLHLSKNKLFGEKDGDPSMRHGKWAVRIKPEIARYEDM